jgi:hypothetical protein
LNLVDGLIGQGLRLLVLVTTNEPLERIHPAVARPGRCMSRIEFLPLTKEEANGWLRVRGCDRRVSYSATIAELHALLAGRDIDRPAPLGFTAAAS